MTGQADVLVRVLGPVEVVVDGAVVGVGAGKPRAVLAALAARANESVSTDELVGWLWDEDAPANPRHTVQVYVMRLRRLMGADSILTTADGYRLVAPVDVTDFERAIGEAGDAEPDVAVGLLRSAERLWRGEPLADVDIEPVRERVAPRLWELRLAAVERRLELDITAGGHEVVGELRTLTAEHPLRERLWTLLVRALLATGRAGEAMAAYHQVREVLADQLGVDPGPELRRLFEDMLDGTATDHPVPQRVRLPPDLRDFVGREDLLERTVNLLVPKGNAMPIVAIVGPPGVGKTALAVHVAHQLHARFPDGRLFLNLHGYSTRPSTTAEQALAHLLRTLGVAAERVPLDVDAQSDLLRALLADKRTLLVLDNAADAEQVRSLLPSGPGCAVLITSRDEMRGLAVTHGARVVSVGVLTDTEARHLLGEMLGAAVDAEPEAVAQLIRLCGALPLALRIAAANIDGRIADHVRELSRRDRLRTLTVTGDIAVSATFDLSYDALSPAAQRLFRLCGVVPTPDITAENAAIIAGISEDDALYLLRELASSHLVQQALPGRYQYHDLLRLYAARRAEVEDSPTDVLPRLLTWYVGVAHRAADLLYPEMNRLDGPRAEKPFPDSGSALSWLDGERINLASIVCHAADAGPHRPAWQLTDALRGYFWIQSDHTAWQSSARAGLRAATIAGDDEATAAMHLSLGTLRSSLGDSPTAITHYDQALLIAGRTGHEQLVAATLNNLACCWQDQGELDKAVECYERALSLCDNTSTRITMSVNLGSVQRELGRIDQARTIFEETLKALHDNRSLQAEVEVLDNLARLHLDQGEVEQALKRAGAALRLAEETDQPRQVAEVHNTLGAARLSQGHPEAAVEHHTHALRAARDLGYQRAEVGALIGLADATRVAGRPTEALEFGHEALALTDKIGLRVRRGRVLTSLARTHLDLGDHKTASTQATEALHIHRETGHRPGEAQALRLLSDLAEPATAEPHRQAAAVVQGVDATESRVDGR